MNNTETRASLIAQAEGLLRNRTFTKEHSARFDALMTLANAMATGDNFRRANASAEMSLVNEQHEAEFRSHVRTGSAITPELRTYSPLGDGSAAAFIPEQWAAAYSQRLVSASGLLKAGATLKELTTGRKYLSFFSDDTGSAAEILAENTQLNDSANPVNPVASVFSPTLNKYATSTVISNELLNDSGFDLDSYLQSLFAVRVARKANNFMTTDATTGLIPKLAALITAGGYGATAASSTVPTLAELSNMQSPAQIDPSYLEVDSQPCYMVGPAMRTTLMQQTGSDGRRLYPEIAKGELLGFALVVNVDQATSAASVAVVFGSIKRAVFVQSAPQILVRSRELKAEFDQTYLALFHRMGAVVQDVNAVTALALHA